jgi:hypothetical protein
VNLILGKQRAYIRTLRRISSGTLRKGASIFRKRGDAAGAELLGGASASAGRGDLGVLQAVGIPLPPPRQSGPSPEGITVIDVGAPVPLPVPSVPDSDLVIARVYGGDYYTGTYQCIIFADVHNAGGGPAPATMTRFLSTQPGQFDVLVATPALAAGETTTVRLDRQYGQWNAASVTADAAGLVVESDEANNTASGAGVPSIEGRCRYP